jgi:RNA polymerase sigma-70 factor, ECF subfamily
MIHASRPKHAQLLSKPTVETTDAELLHKVETGDLTALGVLYDRHARHIWRVLDRVTNGGNDVEDVLHRTFLELPRIAKNFDGRSDSCRNWMCGISVRLALRHARGIRRFSTLLSHVGYRTTKVNAVHPEEIASMREDLRAIETCLAMLSPKKRAVFVLIELEGLSHTEVADTLQIPLGTVRTRLFAAKEELRRALLDFDASMAAEGS